MKTPLIGTGLSGLVGSRFVELFQDKYEFENIDRNHPEHPVDITDYDQLLRVLSQSESPAVIHMAAFTDVNAAWKDKGNKEGLCYRVNVLGTEHIAKACQETGKQLIHLSTAFVFDGEKQEPYTELDNPDPIEWYGQTKLEAEEKIQVSDAAWTILRIDFPFRPDSFVKADIVRKTLSAIERGIPLFDNHYFGPTFIDDLSKILDWAVRTKTTGLFHATNNEQWTDYDFGKVLVEILGINKEVQKGDLNSYLETINRPYQRNTALNCSKLFERLDFEMLSVREALGLVASHIPQPTLPRSNGVGKL